MATSNGKSRRVQKPYGRLDKGSKAYASLTVGDLVALELLKRNGGPMRQSVITQQLRDRGHEINDSSVCAALIRDPRMFRRIAPGVYELGLVRSER